MRNEYYVAFTYHEFVFNLFQGGLNLFGGVGLLPLGDADCTAQRKLSRISHAEKNRQTTIKLFSKSEII